MTDRKAETSGPGILTIAGVTRFTAPELSWVGARDTTILDSSSSPFILVARGS